MLAVFPFYVTILGLAISLIYYLWLRKKGTRVLDAEVAARHTSFILGASLRDFGVWVIDPLRDKCIAKKVTPTHLNIAGMVLGGIAGIFFAIQAFGWGAWVLTLSGICDALDGRVARKTGTASSSGAFLDATMDRIGETLAFTGMALAANSPVLLGLVVLALGGAHLVSYTRAKGEAFGAPILTGVMQRPERLALWIFFTLTSPMLDRYTPITNDIWLSLGFLGMVIGVWLTTIYRILKIHEILSTPRT